MRNGSWLRFVQLHGILLFRHLGSRRPLIRLRRKLRLTLCWMRLRNFSARMPMPKWERTWSRYDKSAVVGCVFVSFLGFQALSGFAEKGQNEFAYLEKEIPEVSVCSIPSSPPLITSLSNANSVQNMFSTFVQQSSELLLFSTLCFYQSYMLSICSVLRFASDLWLQDDFVADFEANMAAMRAEVWREMLHIVVLPSVFFYTVEGRVWRHTPRILGSRAGEKEKPLLHWRRGEEISKPHVPQLNTLFALWYLMIAWDGVFVVDLVIKWQPKLPMYKSDQFFIYQTVWLRTDRCPWSGILAFWTGYQAGECRSHALGYSYQQAEQQNTKITDQHDSTIGAIEFHQFLLCMPERLVPVASAAYDDWGCVSRITVLSALPALDIFGSRDLLRTDGHLRLGATLEWFPFDRAKRISGLMQV